MLKTLSLVAEKLYDHAILWGVGGSLLLSFYKVIDKPNDIDILVAEKNADRLNEIISSISEPKEVLRTDPFRTVHFSTYRMNDIDIDVMGGFAIQHKEGVYKLSLKQESIVTHKKINGVNIPLCSLEDWYILYWLIPNKQDKVLLIEQYLKDNGVSYPHLLMEALNKPLPLEVKERIERLLSYSM